MEKNINDQFEKWKNTEGVEQVSKNMFDCTELANDSGENDAEQEVVPANSPPDGNTEDKTEDGTKTSFAELRYGRKIPRLKKSLVLAIITGGTFVFLFLINVLIQKKDEKEYFNEQGNNLLAGNVFTLGDIERRQSKPEDSGFTVIEEEKVFFRTPPTYQPVPEIKAVSMPPGNTTAVFTSGFSESDLLSMKAQIGKTGGYGLAAYSAVSRNQPDLSALNPEPWVQIPTREEYTRQRLDEIAMLTQATGTGVQTNTDRLNNGRYSNAGIYNPDNTQAGAEIMYLGNNSLFPGTIIHAILVSRIDTDYPGPIHARVTENVYDSMSGKNLLIPQGTILQGNYSSSSIGVSKVQIAWESMVVNYQGTAYQVSLGGMAGVDKRGRAGIAGSLDDHYFEWLKAAGIVSLFTVLNSEVAYQSRNQSSPQLRELMDVNQGIINQIGGRIIDRALAIQPTVRVTNGTPVSISVNAPLNLKPFPAIKAEKKYVRK